MTTVWSGSMEREAIRAQQRPAPEPKPHAGRYACCGPDLVLRSLRLHGPQTNAELQAHTGLDVYRISVAALRLRRRGQILMTRRPDVRRPVYVAVS